VGCYWVTDPVIVHTDALGSLPVKFDLDFDLDRSVGQNVYRVTSPCIIVFLNCHKRAASSSDSGSLVTSTAPPKTASR